MSPRKTRRHFSSKRFMMCCVCYITETLLADSILRQTFTFFKRVKNSPPRLMPMVERFLHYTTYYLQLKFVCGTDQACQTYRDISKAHLEKNCAVPLMAVYFSNIIPGDFTLDGLQPGDPVAVIDGGWSKCCG